MITLTTEFKKNVVEAMLRLRENHEGTDASFSKTLGINSSVFSRIKSGEVDGILSPAQWLNIGRELDVSVSERKWNIVRTAVYNEIEEEIVFCKEYSKSRILVDDCGIGKTMTAKHLSRLVLKSCFYIDCSQAPTKQLFVRLIAKTLGVDSHGPLHQVKANIKYYIKMLTNPIIILDEAGDLDFPAFLVIKEFWNATDGHCAWYMMGADGLREKIEEGKRRKKQGYREIFSRFSENYSTIVPIDNQKKIQFYINLITDVVKANAPETVNIKKIVDTCITKAATGEIGGLRRAESLLILNQQ
jgi:hypothetical protein